MGAAWVEVATDGAGAGGADGVAPGALEGVDGAGEGAAAEGAGLGCE